MSPKRGGLPCEDTFLFLLPTWPTPSLQPASLPTHHAEARTARPGPSRSSCAHTHTLNKPGHTNARSFLSLPEVPCRLLTRTNELGGLIFLYVFPYSYTREKGIREHLPFKNAALRLRLHLYFLFARKASAFSSRGPLTAQMHGLQLPRGHYSVSFTFGHHYKQCCNGHF